MGQYPIDIVVTWVDGSDEAWLQEKAKYQVTKSGDHRASRYREWGFLRYWFRAIETNAPWLHKIHFVTWGHVPEWLDTKHERLCVVKHEDFIPRKYLPTFSCRPIEFNLHRIPGLSEHFVYFNDDMYLLRPSRREDFFVGGLPCDIGVLDATVVNGMTSDGQKVAPQDLYTSLIYNLMVINRNFDKRASISANRSKWLNLKYGKLVSKTLLLAPWKKFTGFHTEHIPYSLLRSTYDRLWSAEPEILDRTCSHRFRSPEDVSSRLLSFWQIAEGSFYPRSPHVGVMRSISDDMGSNADICKRIRERSSQMLCINDDYHGSNFESVDSMFLDAFESIFPERSSFERV